MSRATTWARAEGRARWRAARRMAVWALGIVMLLGRAPSVAAHEDDQGPARSSPTLAVVAGRTITASDVDRVLGNRLLSLRAEEYRQRRQALDELIGETVLAVEAARRGVSVAALLQQEVDRKVRPVSDEECRAAYERSRANLGGLAEAEALRSIAEALRRQYAAERRQAFIAELARSADVTVTLEPPRIAIDAAPESATRGPAGAPVTVVEFTDFQCPYCRQMAALLAQLETEYGGRVRRVVRHFPLQMHPEAPAAAEAALCAGRQGQFWAMHERLFATQTTLRATDLKRAGEVVGLDRSAFDACVMSGATRAVWQRDRADAERYGVAGTPAVFINGRPILGLIPAAELKQIIDEELARAAAPARAR